MAAYTLNDIYARDAERISGRIYSRSVNRSVWNKLIPKEPWPTGVADTLKFETIERNLPDNTDTWNDMVTAGSGNCVPTEYEVGSGSTERSATLQQKVLVSENICVDTTRGAYRVQEQAKYMFKNLTRAVSYVWKRRALTQYIDQSEHKMVATHGMPYNADDFPAIVPTSVLTQKMLGHVYQNLIMDNAEEDGGSLGSADSRPQFILVCGAETSDTIMRETNNANAFLYNSNRVPELLAPLGVERAIRGFYHVIDTHPPRYTFSAGVWTEVPPFGEVAADKGTKRKISSAYQEAPYEDSVIFLPSVMSFMIPQPISTIGSKTKWNPQNYMGEFDWLNIQDRTINPKNLIGFYYATLASAVKPVAPDFGYVIRHLRCFADIDHTACDETGSEATSSLISGAGGDSYFNV